jgi:alpha-tubulin suppressor-like RCC1 family protein
MKFYICLTWVCLFTISFAQLRRTSSYALGLNNEGQLGLGTNDDAYFPQPITWFRQKKVKQIALGDSCYLILFDDCTVWSYGKNSAGSLGLGHEIDAISPTNVVALNGANITRLSVPMVSLHSSLQGLAFGFGENQDGELCTGDMKNRNSPTLISSLNTIGVSEIYEMYVDICLNNTK